MLKPVIDSEKFSNKDIDIIFAISETKVRDRSARILRNKIDKSAVEEVFERYHINTSCLLTPYHFTSRTINDCN